MTKKKTFEGHSKYFIAVTGRKHNVSHGGGIVSKNVQGYTVKPRKRKMSKIERQSVKAVYMREYGDFVSVSAARKRASELDKEVRQESKRRKLKDIS